MRAPGPSACPECDRRRLWRTRRAALRAKPLALLGLGVGGAAIGWLAGALEGRALLMAIVMGLGAPILIACPFPTDSRCGTCRTRCGACGGRGVPVDAERVERREAVVTMMLYGLGGLGCAFLFVMAEAFSSLFLTPLPAPATVMIAIALPTGGAWVGWMSGRDSARTRLRRAPGPLRCTTCGMQWTA